MIDLHSHILPGVDDGAATLADSLSIASACVRSGVTTLAATPHVRPDYLTSAATMEELVHRVQSTLEETGIPLDVRRGGEISLDTIDDLADEELHRFGLGGNPSYLLVEFSYYGWPLGLGAVLARLDALGITAVLAHPERNAEVQADPERLRPAVERGALVQVTAASLDGRGSRAARETGLALVRNGLAHLLASDAHRAEVREAGMQAAARTVGEEALARWLTEEVPGAIVTGEPIPPRPRPSARRRRWSRG